MGRDSAGDEVVSVKNAVLQVSDIEIGAVEIKNGTDDTRATVTAGNALKVDGSGVTQPVSIASVPSHAVTNAGTFAVQNSDVGFSFSNLLANATTTIKSGAGVLHSVVINTKGIGNTLTIYDNTAGSGTKVGTVDTTLSTTSFLYDVAFTTGLTVVIAGGTAADLTFTYR